MTTFALIVGLAFLLYAVIRYIEVGGHRETKRQLARLQDAFDQSQDDLSYYGQHDPACQTTIYGNECDCGYLDAVRREP